MSADNRGGAGQKNWVVVHDIQLSADALHDSTKLALQHSILMESGDVAELFVPAAKLERALDALSKNFHCLFMSEQTPIWSGARHEDVNMGIIHLPAHVASAVRDGMAKDTIKFATHGTPASPEDINYAVGQVIDERARSKH